MYQDQTRKVFLMFIKHTHTHTNEYKIYKRNNVYKNKNVQRMIPVFWLLVLSFTNKAVSDAKRHSYVNRNV